MLLPDLVGRDRAALRASRQRDDLASRGNDREGAWRAPRQGNAREGAGREIYHEGRAIWAQEGQAPVGAELEIAPPEGQRAHGLDGAAVDGLTRQTRVAPRCTDQQSTVAPSIGVARQERGPREAASRRGRSRSSLQSSHWVGDTGRKASQGPVKPAMPRVDAPKTLIVETIAASLAGA